MRDEQDLPNHQFHAFPELVIRSKDAALREILMPCGQFASPLSLRERARIFLSQKLSASDLLANVTNVIAPGTPLNWHVLLKYLFDRGIILEPHFRSSPRANDAPSAFAFELRAKPRSENTDGTTREQYATASSLDAEGAMSRTVGEMLERYYLTLYKRDWFIRASAAELRKTRDRALDISQLNTFFPWQEKINPRLARDENSPIHWVKGEQLGAGSAYIPAQFVFWNYDFSSDREEPVLAHATTNGAAGHFTRDAAILGGVLELIERDGFLIYWLNSLSPRRVDPSGVKDEEFETLMTGLKRYGLDIHFLDVTTDVGIPSICAVLIDTRGDEPSLVVSAAAGFNALDTIAKSAREALNIFHFGARRKEFSLPETHEPFSDKGIGQSERIALWKGEKMMRRFSFFLQGDLRSTDEFLRGTPQFLDTADRLSYVLDKLRPLGEGYDVYFYEARNPVLKTLGYHVVQTVVPQLIPMYLVETLATLDSKRLREVPAKLGFKPAAKFNPWPHPFP